MDALRARLHKIGVGEDAGDLTLAHVSQYATMLVEPDARLDTGGHFSRYFVVNLTRDAVVEGDYDPPPPNRPLQFSKHATVFGELAATWTDESLAALVQVACGELPFATVPDVLYGYEPRAAVTPRASVAYALCGVCGGEADTGRCLSCGAVPPPKLKVVKQTRFM